MAEILTDKDLELTLEEYAILSVTNSISFSDSKEPRVYTSKQTYLWADVICSLIKQGVEEDEIVAIVEDRIKWILELGGWFKLSTDISPILDLYPNKEGRRNLVYDKRNVDEYLEQINQIMFRVGNMEQQCFIEDPFVETIGGVSFAVLGFIPVGFTKRTKKGETTYLKINALFWKYEQTRNKGEIESNLQFKFHKVWKAIREVILKLDKPEEDD